MLPSGRRVPVGVLAGIAVSAAVVALLVWLVGPGAVGRVLVTADPGLLLGALAVGLVWIGAWAGTFHLVATRTGLDPSPGGSALLYTLILFANNVTPFSVLGGEPLAALLIARATRVRYESALATVVSTDVLNFVPAPPLAAAGLVWIVSLAAVAPAATVSRPVLIVGLAGIVVIGYAAWRGRRTVIGWGGRTLVRVAEAVHRRLPGLPIPSQADVDERIDHLRKTLTAVAGDRRLLLGGVGFATLGWSSSAATLWLALTAVGSPVPYGVPLVLVPLATVADVVPLPGGVGVVEPVLVLLLVAATGIPATSATAATLVHRGLIVGLPVVLGGGTLGWFAWRSAPRSVNR